MTLVNDAGGEWDIKADIQTRRANALKQALNLLKNNPVTKPQSLEEKTWELTFVFESGNNLLTQADVDIMKSVESVVLNHPNYPKYCQLVRLSLAPLESQLSRPILPPHADL